LGKLDVNEAKEKQNAIGLDLGEVRHRFCVLDEAGEVLEQGSLKNERVALAVMEAGTHSPWIRTGFKSVDERRGD
jgi:hypothetical protein